MQWILSDSGRSFVRVPVLVSPHPEKIERPVGKEYVAVTEQPPGTGRRPAPSPPPGRVSWESLTELLELSPDALVVINQDGTLVQANEQAATLFGYPLPELLGQPLEMLLPERLRAVHTAHRQRYFAAPATRPMGTQLELAGRRQDGSEFPVDISLRPLRLAGDDELLALGAVRDTSERRQLEQRLRTSEREAQERAALLEAIFEALPDTVFVLSAEGSLMVVNTAAHALLARLIAPEDQTRATADLLAHLVIYDEQGQPLPVEQWPAVRVLAGEVLTPERAASISIATYDGQLRDTQVTGGPLYDADGHLTAAVMVIRDVTERKRTEREREQQAQQLELQSRLLALAHDAILVRDPESRVLYWNQGAEQLYGWSAEEARGRVTHSLLQTVFPTSPAQVDEQLERDGYWEGELVHTGRDGRLVVVESRHALVRDGRGRPTAILEINRDITRRRQLEQQAQVQHAETVARLSFFQQLIDALPGGIYLVYGQEARLLLANRAAASVWGATWQSDQPLGEFLAGAGIGIMTAQGQPMPLSEMATLRAVRRGETVRHLQEVIRRPDGTSLPVLVNAVVLDVPEGWQLLRPRSEASGALRLASTETMALVLHQDVSALKEAEYLKDEFIGVAAHELRNPLGALKGFADMLVYQTAQGRGPQLADWQREALKEIEQAAARLDKLTEDLLDVTRLQAGRLSLSRKPTDLVGLVRQQIRQAQMTTRSHALSFETELPSLVVEVDRGRIEQVLANLLNNAIKYSPQGGLVEVALRQDGEPGSALLSVRDHGIGIPAGQQARLFGRFVRAENARAAEITGTGLGLYLSREFVERHGWRLWFESVEGVGSTFYLRLSLSPPAPEG
jgi:PAS domain S-box-containing protein